MSKGETLIPLAQGQAHLPLTERQGETKTSAVGGKAEGSLDPGSYTHTRLRKGARRCRNINNSHSGTQV